MALVSEDDRQRIAQAIKAAERKTSGEIVTVIASESSPYMHIPFMWSALIALVVPWPFIHFTWMPVHYIWAIQLVVFAVLLGVLFYRPFRYALVPRSMKRERAHRRAVEQFLTQNLHTTDGRTGVLIFVSIAERYAEILADAGIHTKVPPSDWKDIVDQLTDCISNGRSADGFVGAIDAVGARLALHFPPGTIDPSRLPNHLIVLD